MKERVRSLGARVVAALLVLAVAQAAGAQEPVCPLPNQKPLLMVQMFFGLSVRGRAPVNPSEWNRFLRRDVTPRFPEGLTVYDGYGQWLSPKSHAIVRENSKIMVIATQDSEGTRKRIVEVADLYRKNFHQQAVGVFTTPACGAF